MVLFLEEAYKTMEAEATIVFLYEVPGPERMGKEEK